MKHITILIAIIFIFPSITLFAEEYKNYENHYTLSVPEGWLDITEQEREEIEFQANALLSPDNQMKVNYVTGYKDYKNESGWLLIQEHPFTTSTELLFENMSPGFIKSDEENENFTLINQDIDPVFDAYFVEALLTDNNESIAMFIMAFPGREKITQLNYYVTTFSFEETMQKVIDSATSFKYANGYEYQEPGGMKEDSTEEGVAGLISGLFAVIVFGGISWFISLFKKKDKK